MNHNFSWKHFVNDLNDAAAANTTVSPSTDTNESTKERRWRERIENQRGLILNNASRTCGTPVSHEVHIERQLAIHASKIDEKPSTTHKSNQIAMSTVTLDNLDKTDLCLRCDFGIKFFEATHGLNRTPKQGHRRGVATE